MSRQSLLLTDLHQLSMPDAYAAHGMAKTAAFALFAASLARLPVPLRALKPASVPVEISNGIRAMAADLDRYGR